MRSLLYLLLPVIPLVSAAGCQRNESGVPSAIAEQYQSQLLSADAPTEAKSVSEIRAQLADSSDAEVPQPVVITGTIGKMPTPFPAQHPEFPWVADAASFFLVDDATVEEFAKHGHAKGEECSFCLAMAGRRTDRVALIEIHQQDGKPVPYRADALLGLKEGDHLVVEGSASLIMGTMLVVTPTSIHVGPPSNQAATSADSLPNAEADSSAQAD